MDYQITYDPKMDAINWYHALTKTTYRSNWKHLIPENIAKNVASMAKDEAIEYLTDYLTAKHQETSSEINNYIKYVRHKFKENFKLACSQLEQITDHPLYKDNFKIYITTIKRAPYDYETGSIWLPIRANPIDIFMHETLHFQFIHYYRNNPNSKVSRLSEKDFDWLKEAQTVILDQDLVPPMDKPDRGHPIHKEFRHQLHQFWQKNHDFDELVGFGLQLLKQNSC